MKIAIIPDEYTYDPSTAFELGRGWGLEHYEIRYAYRWRVPHAPAWVSDCVANAVTAYDVTVTAISPGLFKPVMCTDGSEVPVSVDTPGEIRRHLDELLPLQFAFAERLGTRNITIFSLPRPADVTTAPVPSIVVDTLAEAADRAAGNGFALLLENLPGTWADTGEATAALVEAVGSEALGVTWDPANVVYGQLAEDPVQTGYPAVGPHVANVHVKDAQVVDGRAKWVQMGEGVVDWSDQLGQLQRSGYAGFLTIEPHLQYEPGITGLVETTKDFVMRVRDMLGQKRSS